MYTPQYDAIKGKVRDWSNRREVATIPTSIIEDCLRYGMDDIYRNLRIPQLEFTRSYVVGESNNTQVSYSTFDVPENLIEFIYLAKRDASTNKVDIVYNQVNDIRTFLDPFADQYSHYRYVWKDFKILVSPKLAIGDVIELHYYRRLPALDALYSVIPENYSFDYAPAFQPLLSQAIEVTDTPTSLWLVTGGTTDAAFSSLEEANAYIVTNGGTAAEEEFIGRESWNWIRDSNERLCIFSALRHVGAYMRDETMEKKYEEATAKVIVDLNREEKFRRAKGGNVQINVNTGGLI